jgi:hypothetical protein
VDIGSDRLRIADRLAETDDSVIGMEPQPDKIGEGSALDRLDGGDLHEFGAWPYRVGGRRCVGF